MTTQPQLDPAPVAPATAADARAVIEQLRATRARMTPGELIAHRDRVYPAGGEPDDLTWYDAHGIAALVNAADALIAVAEAAAGLVEDAEIAEHDEMDPRGKTIVRVVDVLRVRAALAAVAGLDRSAGA